jgi:hypothetical protein
MPYPCRRDIMPHARGQNFLSHPDTIPTSEPSRARASLICRALFSILSRHLEIGKNSKHYHLFPNNRV